ncbi:MAG: hypothetical protein IT452_07300, partial [Planctomycetia bacterium]|nr:hypothetical protein [Planctomycetia bacterium]
ARFMNEELVHHHVRQGRFAAPVPRSLHLELSIAIHKVIGKGGIHVDCVGAQNQDGERRDLEVRHS